MTILITGGAGFIGSNLADEFVRLGHRVLIVDNLSTGRREHINPKALFFEMDIRDARVADLLRDHRVEAICHHAAQMDVRRSVAEPIFDAEVNVLGMLNLLEGAVRSGVRKFVFASTGGAIYGEQDYFPADELHIQRPCSPYGITKLTGEKYLFFYRQTHRIEYVALRYANVYGPRQNPHGEAGVVAIFAKKLLAGEQPVINGSGDQTRDYVFVKDVVKANVAALAFPGSDSFNVGTGVETSVNELFRQLLSLCESSAREVHGEAKPGEQQRSVLDCRKAMRILQWQPDHSLQDGLRLTVEYFKNQRQSSRTS